jgi:hypothetical protein
LSCFNTDMETNECLSDNGGCWQDKAANVTACRVCMNMLMIFTGHHVLNTSLCFLTLLLSTLVQDTFRGRVCECPTFNGVQFKGDGYTTCEGEMT